MSSRHWDGLSQAWVWMWNAEFCVKMDYCITIFYTQSIFLPQLRQMEGLVDYYMSAECILNYLLLLLLLFLPVFNTS